MYEREMERNLKEPEITLWTCRKCGCNEFSYKGKKNHNCVESLAKTGRKFGGLTGKQIVPMTKEEIKEYKPKEVKPEKSKEEINALKKIENVCKSILGQLGKVSNKKEFEAIKERFDRETQKFMDTKPNAVPDCIEKVKSALEESKKS